MQTQALLEVNEVISTRYLRAVGAADPEIRVERVPRHREPGDPDPRSRTAIGHDLADGGLSQALVESCLRGGLGVSLTLPDGDPTVALFSESPARAIASLPAASWPASRTSCWSAAGGCMGWN